MRQQQRQMMEEQQKQREMEEQQKQQELQRRQVCSSIYNTGMGFFSGFPRSRCQI